ncbi:MAG: hypothetical protein ACETWD_11495 [Desulfatiglandales bacterium]
MRKDFIFAASPSDGVMLTFEGTISNLLDYEYHQSTDNHTYYNNRPSSVAMEFSIDMKLGIVYERIPLSDFLVLDEPSRIYTEMNWKDLNQFVSSADGSHYLHYSEAHIEGYDKATFYSHRVEFGNGDSVRFPEVYGEAWGNGNDRYDLLYEYLNVQKLFSYKEHAYTVFNWNPAMSSPDLIRTGQEATGTLTLIGVEESTQPIPESTAVGLSHIGQIVLAGFKKKFRKE